jgi:HEPN domain-containing protein
MTPDQLRLEETRAWLDRARRDLRAAELLIAGEAGADALFHYQQAVEKALKAFLTFHQRPFRRTHDLSDLSPECLSIDETHHRVVVNAESLTQYAWGFRYPGAPYEPGVDEVDREFQKARAVVGEIGRRLNS